MNVMKISSKLLTISWLIGLLTLAQHGHSNPLPEPTFSAQGHNRHSLDVASSPSSYPTLTVYYTGNDVEPSVPNSLSNELINPQSPVLLNNTGGIDIEEIIGSSASTLIKETLVKPSVLTFKLNRFCDMDVSLDRIVCSNLRKRSDLPQKVNYFNGIQQAVFVNVSGEGDLRLEDFRRLFPNLIVLSITQSPYSSASLINLQSTNQSGHWASKASPIPKSLLSNPIFAKRINNVNSNFLKIMSARLNGNGSTSVGNRNGRAVSSPSPTVHEEDTNSTVLFPNNIFQENSSLDDKHQMGNEKGNDKNSLETNDIVADKPFDQNLDKQLTAERIFSLSWPSVRHLNLSWNELTSEALPTTDFVANIFPNLEHLDLSHNFITKVDKWNELDAIDISANPLDCRVLDWVSNSSTKLLRPNQTLCAQPPHQNKPKPIIKVLRLLQNVRNECQVNCSCDIAYIWEQNHIVRSKIVVNCSGRGLTDFPDPTKLPKPIYTLDLSNNNISSLSEFVGNPHYDELQVTNLHLDDNQVSSIDILESSKWFYNFQVFTIRRNRLTEVPIHVLENVFRENKRLVHMDLSSNKYKCDCFTVSSFKVWLLKFPYQIRNIEDVRCHETREQIRYMRLEDWCHVEQGTNFLEILDLVSIVLALLIVVVIAKVYYDYKNFKTKGKLPWLVRKM